MGLKKDLNVCMSDVERRLQNIEEWQIQIKESLLEQIANLTREITLIRKFFVLNSKEWDVCTSVESRNLEGALINIDTRKTIEADYHRNEDGMTRFYLQGPSGESICVYEVPVTNIVSITLIEED